MAKKNLYCVYFLSHKGQGKYHAQIQDDDAHKQLATGGFPSVDAVKKWARQWAKAKGAKITIERIR